MNIIYKTLIAASFFLLLMSCEKEIKLDLDESEQKIVIEALLHDSLGDNLVIISKTKPFTSAGPIDYLSNLQVQIDDNNGTVYTLSEIEPGHYSNPTLTGAYNTNYTLTVIVDGVQFSASSFLPPHVAIDSLGQEQIPEIAQEDPDVPEYRVLCYFTDPAGTVNYYHFKTFNEGEQVDGFFVLRDDYIEGLSTYYPLFDNSYIDGDVVDVELLATAEFNYIYFNALSLSQEGQVPGNPISNFSNSKVVGYFTAASKSKLTIVIEDE